MAETFEELTGTDLPDDKKLKELLGHTPLQVVCGCALGLVVAIVVYIFFR